MSCDVLKTHENQIVCVLYHNHKHTYFGALLEEQSYTGRHPFWHLLQFRDLSAV